MKTAKGRCGNCRLPCIAIEQRRHLTIMAMKCYRMQCFILSVHSPLWDSSNKPSAPPPPSYEEKKIATQLLDYLTWKQKLCSPLSSFTADFYFFIFSSFNVFFFSSHHNLQGPECESIEIGDVQGTKLIFVGIDRISAIALFSVPPDGNLPIFESIHRDGHIDKSFSELYRTKEFGDSDPESIT